MLSYYARTYFQRTLLRHCRRLYGSPQNSWLRFPFDRLRTSLESVYEAALALELARRDIAFDRQKRLPVFYRDEQVGDLKADFIIEDKIILELKAVKEISEIHEAQAHNYLAASGLKLAIIINFGSSSLEHIRRVV